MPREGLSAETNPRAQIETRLDKAEQLSVQVGNTVFLKREDMQQVISSNQNSFNAGFHMVCCQEVCWLPLGGKAWEHSGLVIGPHSLDRAQKATELEGDRCA